jgi:Cdc6-like AAA superfamily ATPase
MHGDEADLGSPDPPQQRLAGVDGTIAKCLDYLTLSALQSESCSVSPLLLTGSKGSGRTSIAKRVADLLEGDRETLAGQSMSMSLSRACQ